MRKNKKVFKGITIVLTCALLIPVSKIGAANIQENEAETIARKYVPEGSNYLTTGYDDDDGRYEVKFFHKANKESYEVDIYENTGEIYSFESEKVSNNGSKKVKISENEAKQKVKNELKDVTILSINLDYDDGLKEYKVTFSGKNYRGKYKINPKTGAILERDIKVKKTNTQGNNNTITNQNNIISEEKAKQTALNKVPGATILKCKLDEDDGIWLYELELYKDNYKYEIEINAKDGTIIKYDKEKTDDYDDEYTNQNNIISEKKAKQIALNKVPGATILKCELDEDDGIWFYELELYKDTYEYEIEISAKDGTIIKYDRERTDYFDDDYNYDDDDYNYDDDDYNYDDDDYYNDDDDEYYDD